MPSKPDTPCTTCGKLLWPSTTPAERRICRDCTRKAKARPCGRCGTTIHAGTYCSRTCAAPGTTFRTCEVCAKPYRAASPDQRTCSRTCGRAIRRAPEPKPRPAKPPRNSTCRVCGSIATNATWRVICSSDCKLKSIGDRIKDLYRMACLPYQQGGAEWRRILIDHLRTRDGDHCHLCHEVIDFTLRSGPKGSDAGASIDHLTPRSRGGKDDPTNLKLAHWGCNRARGARPLAEAARPDHF